MGFEELNLHADILKAIKRNGFDEPTPIQKRCIPAIKAGRDVVGQSLTGSGKTAAFGLPILEKIQSGRGIQALILTPTRELTEQVKERLISFSQFLHIRITAVYGGVGMQPQIDAVKQADIVVATPGRLLDHISHHTINLSKVSMLVLDEADKMFEMGFLEDVEEIIRHVPKNRQTLLFGATLSSQIQHLIKKHLREPCTIREQLHVDRGLLKQIYYEATKYDKFSLLVHLLKKKTPGLAIVFCSTRREVDVLARNLKLQHIHAMAVHGGLSQNKRTEAVDSLKKEDIQVLVATDVAARGIDVHDLTHIINYNLPDDPEIYLHRTGRTGRAGKTGIAISLIHTRESGRIKDIERMIKKNLDRKKVPGGKEICETQLLNMVDKVENTVVDNEHIAKYLPAINEKLARLDREELIKHFISFEFNRFLEYYKDAPDLNVNQNDKHVPSKQSRPDSFARLHINLGAKQNLTAGSLMSFINRNCNGNRILFGKIEILRKFSFFEIEESRMKNLLAGMNNVLYDGIPVKVEISSPAAPDYAFKKSKKKKNRSF